jgi:hypothetical protein
MKGMSAIVPLSSTHPPCKQVLTAVEGAVVLMGRYSAALCRDVNLMSSCSVLVGAGGISVDMAKHWSEGTVTHLAGMPSLFTSLTLIDSLRRNSGKAKGEN